MNEKRNDKFEGSLPNTPAYVKFFSGANTNQLDYYIVSVLVDEKPNNITIYIRPNDILKFNYNNANEEDLDHRIINIGLKFTS